jgi:hypothetical protein
MVTFLLFYGMILFILPCYIFYVDMRASFFVTPYFKFVKLLYFPYDTLYFVVGFQVGTADPQVSNPREFN